MLDHNRFSLSDRQRFAYKTIINPANRMVLLEGGVGSGKTLIALLSLYRLFRLQGGRIAIVANTRELLEGNLAHKLQMIASLFGDSYKVVRNRFGTSFYVGRVRFIGLSGYNIQARGRVQGHEVDVVYIDEVTNIDEDVVEELMQRSRPKPKIVMTCNPEGYKHWFYTNYIKLADQKGLCRVRLNVEHNPTMGAEYADHVRDVASHNNSLLNRRVLGEWTPLQGLVYPNLPEPVAFEPEGEIVWRGISIDPAVSGVTHAILAEQDEAGTVWITNEWRHDGLQGELTRAEQSRLIHKRLGSNIDNIVVDSNDPESRWQIAELYPNTPVKKANKKPNDKNRSIEFTAVKLYNGEVRLTPGCPELYDELRFYEWDENAAKKGEEKPLKVRDHGCDALRYLLTTIRLW